MEVNKKWEFSSFCTAVIVDGVFCWDVNPSKEAWRRGRDDDVLGQDTGVLVERWRDGGRALESFHSAIFVDSKVWREIMGYFRRSHGICRTTQLCCVMKIIPGSPSSLGVSLFNY